MDIKLSKEQGLGLPKQRVIIAQTRLIFSVFGDSFLESEQI
jgi:hypothetical protein